MDLNKQHNKTRQDLERMKQERIKNHKCKKCVWGKWTETKYKCALPRCMKKLGYFERG